MRFVAASLIAIASLASDAAEPRSIEIPFRWTPGQIELQVSINGRDPIWCILDSGAEFSMLDRETSRTLGLAPTHGKQIENLTLEIGPLRLPRQTVTLWALDNFRRQNRDIRGVIGCTLFERYVVTIDYQRHVVILIEPASFRPSSSATGFPITFSGRLPVIKANLKFAGRQIPSRLMVDTGASQAVILRYPFAAEHRLFGSSDAKSISETVASGKRAFVTLSAEELELGRWKFQNPAVKAYGSRAGAGGDTSTDGLLGNDVLRHFRVTFDYSRKRMFLEETKAIR